MYCLILNATSYTTTKLIQMYTKNSIRIMHLFGRCHKMERTKNNDNK